MLHLYCVRSEAFLSCSGRGFLLKNNNEKKNLSLSFSVFFFQCRLRYWVETVSTALTTVMIFFKINLHTSINSHHSYGNLGMTLASYI